MESLPKEERIQLAIKAIQSGTSERSVATTFNVPRTSIRNRQAGMQPNKVSKSHMQRFTPEKEGSICRVIQQMHLQGWPIGISGLEALVQQLLDQKGDSEPLGKHNILFYTIILTSIGKNWRYNFLNRQPELKKLRSRALDQSRKDATNFETAKHWFDLYATTRVLYDINDSDIYNIDEKGYMKGIGDNYKVFVPQSEVEAFSA